MEDGEVVLVRLAAAAFGRRDAAERSWRRSDVGPNRFTLRYGGQRRPTASRRRTAHHRPQPAGELLHPA